DFGGAWSACIYTIKIFHESVNLWDTQVRSVLLRFTRSIRIYTNETEVGQKLRMFLKGARGSKEQRQAMLTELESNYCPGDLTTAFLFGSTTNVYTLPSAPLTVVTSLPLASRFVSTDFTSLISTGPLVPRNF